MAQDVTAYDQSSTLYSPDGRLYQVEYARKAVERGSLVLGFVAKDGVALLGHKRLFSKLIIPKNIEKLFRLTDTIGCAASGLLADSRVLVEYAQDTAANHKYMYGEPVDCEDLARSVCKLLAVYSHYGGARPFGSSLIIAGEDDTGRHLIQADVSGIKMHHSFIALGSESDKLSIAMESSFVADRPLSEQIPAMLAEMQNAVGEPVTVDTVDMGWARPGKGFCMLTSDESAGFLSNLPPVSSKKEPPAKSEAADGKTPSKPKLNILPSIQPADEEPEGKQEEE